MAAPTMDQGTQDRPSLLARLGLNPSTSALLLAILLIGMGQELWAPFMPKFIQQSLHDYLKTHLWHLRLSQTAIIVLAVGLFGTWKDLQEAIYYYIGGRIGGTLGTRISLIAFATLPLIGYVLLLSAFTPALATIMAFASLPFISAYDSISQPATLTVVGDTLKSHLRIMAFSLQAIQRRISRIIAYLVAGMLVYIFGAVLGVKVGVAISFLLVLLAVVLQVRMLKTDSRDTAARKPGFSLNLFRRFHPELRKLLLADIFARIAEGMPRELFVLYAVASADIIPGFGFATFSITPARFGQLLAVMSFTSLITYLPIGYIASRPGGQKKPFIALTFVFFALFPLAFWWLGHLLGIWGLVIAYIIGGLREIGEPARKAIITELLPPDARTAATGLYWSVRSFAVMLAPLLGAVLWITISPAAAFITPFVVGIIGAIMFALLFNRSGGPTNNTAPAAAPRTTAG